MPRDLAEYQADLKCAFCACQRLYLETTASVPPDDKSLAWQEKCETLDRRLFAPIISLLNLRQANIPEICLVALKLLEFAGASARMLDPPNEKEV